MFSLLSENFLEDKNFVNFDALFSLELSDMVVGWIRMIPFKLMIVGIEINLFRGAGYTSSIRLIGLD